MDKREYWRSGLELSTGEGLVVWNARKKAEKDGDLKGARRLRAIHLVGISHYTQKTVGEILEVSENAVTRWVMTFQQEGVTGLRTRKPPGPKSRLTEAQKKKLERLVRKGPEACGFDTGVWDAKLVGELVKREFGVEYHPTSIRRLLKDLGFSLQYPKKVLGGANAESQRRWVKKVYPSVKKKAEKDGGVVLFQDEVVFQQEGTIHRTWAPVGEGAEVTSQPVRKSAKVFGAIRIDAKEPKFHFRFETGRFNTETFTRYLQQLVGYYRPRGQKVFLILDNVSYHHAAQRWAIQHPEEIELHFLPPYSPELNPTEQVWRRTKRVATHNRHFRTLEDLREAILRRFNRYQGNPKSLSGIVKRWL